MADFRKWILALAVLSLFAGLAGAQGSNTIQCSNATGNVPLLRSEGFTELTGDILLACSGPAQGTVATPLTTNITVFLNGTITSRLLPTSAFGTGSIGGGTPSEILLLLDEPGGSGGGSISACTSPNAGNGTGGCTGTPNAFQGVVNAGGGSVTFYGVPVLPPTTAFAGTLQGGTCTPTAGSSTCTGATGPVPAVWSYRITNIRVNANGITGGGSIPASAQAFISSIALPPIPQFPVGLISTSLATSINAPFSTTAVTTSAITKTQCTGVTTTSSGFPLETLVFSEIQGQGSAFKPRVSATPNQLSSVPGISYNTESGFIPGGAFTSTGVSGASTQPGLADWGTRLKAVFSNVPSGVSLYVSTSNLPSGATNAPAVANAPIGTSSYAVLISTSADSTPDTGTATPTSGLAASATSGTGGVGYIQVPVVNGSATAVWEVINSIPNQPENFYFSVFASFTANNALASTTSVAMSYAPTPSGGGFTAATGGQASSSLGLPRFNDTGTGRNALIISICQTALLFPYVINTNGFDTGLAIANTSQDPFGTTAQSGYCTLNWYGSGTPATNPGFLGSAGYQTTTPTSTQSIAAGTIQAWGASVVAPGFSGYVIAVCNFQYAHGFAFVSDLGARNLAMGYLADVINGTITNTQRGGTAPAAAEANGQ
jgi:hypothetical protein